MTPEEFAAEITGRKAGKAISPEDQKAARKSGLVVMVAGFEAIEIYGAVEDEVPGLLSDDFAVTRNGYVSWGYDEDCEMCPHFRRGLAGASEFRLVGAGTPLTPYRFYTKVRHVEFPIMQESGEGIYCYGIVFRMIDLVTVDIDWIPVKDQLPPPDVEVLVWVEDASELCFAGVTLGAYSPTDGWSTLHVWVGSRPEHPVPGEYDYWEVTHWKPEPGRPA